MHQHDQTRPYRRAMQRRIPLQRTGGPRRRAPIRARSAKREAELPERELVRHAVFARDGACLLTGHPQYGGACRGVLTPHHLRKEGQGGPYTLSNLVALCVWHNEWVELYPLVAHSLGLVIRAGEQPEWAWQRLRARGLAR